MAQTKIKAGLFEGIIGNGTDGYFLMSNGDGTMAWSSIIINPTITGIAYPGSVTAADPAGGETITVTGTGFNTGATVTVGGTAAPAVSYVSETQITFTTPAKAAGDYDIVVTNTDTGSATYINGISYNGIPSWTTAAGSLGTFASDTTISTITLQASEPDAGTITFSITNGALPTGLSLTGADIDGTTSLETADTLYTFTVTATDDESQATPRTFTITVTKQFINTENFTINTYTGNGSTQSIEGKIGTAANFNGSNSRIAAPKIPGLSSASISCWVKTVNTASVSRGIVELNNDTGSNGYAGTLSIIYNTGSGTFTIRNGNGSSSEVNLISHTDVTIRNGNWHHIVVARNESTGVTTLYIDGTQAAQQTVSSTSTAGPGTLIGDRYYAASNFHWDGEIDQVRIFNKALSSSEVTTLYGESNTSTTKSTTDIFDDGSGVALYEFEEGAKDTGGVNGYIGAGGIFNGSSSKIDINSLVYPVSLKGTIDEFSISLWFKSNASPNGNEEFLNWWSGDASDVYPDGFLGLASGNTIRFGDGWTNTYTFPNTNYVGSWTHIVAIKSTNNAYLYINGSLVATKGSSLSWGFNRNLIIGGDQGSGEYFNGSLDQIRLFDKALSSSEVTTLYGETSASSTKSTTDIFDDGSGVALYELDGNANDSGRFGRGAIDSGQSAVFNGTTSIFNFPNTAYGASTTVFTVSGWFKHTSTANNREDIYFGNGATVSGNTGYALFTDYSSGNIALSFRDADQSQVFYTSSSNIKDGSWYHLCLTYNNGAYVVYLNGASILNGTSPDFINNQTPTYVTYIGNRYGSTGSGTSIIGAVDQVRVYSSALSASDVEALVSETNVPTTNLTAHYKLDGNANDETGTYNGTATSITYSDPAEFPTYDGTATNVSYAYDGTPTNVSFVGTSFQPDLVWIKARSGTYGSNPHRLEDSVRGSFYLSTSSTAGEAAVGTGIQSYDTNGFTVGSGNSYNGLSTDFVAWCWKAGGSVTPNNNTQGTITSTVSANPDAGFSIVKWTGNEQSSQTIGHGLSSTPELAFIKQLDGTREWQAPLFSLNSGDYLILNSTASKANDTNRWSAIDSSTITVGAQPHTNGNGSPYIGYFFHSVDGYQKVGSYTGTGQPNNDVTTGFRPRWVMIKSTAAQGWNIIDSVRNPSNPANLNIQANDTAAESSTANPAVQVDFDDTGFSLVAPAGTAGEGQVNSNGATYIYLAIA